MTDQPATSYDGTLARTADGGVIRFERALPYPIREVWDAVTNPERLADWWLPFDADITVDLREGGQMVFTSRDGGGDGDSGGGTGEPITLAFTISRLEPPMLLEHTHVDPGSLLRWELEPTDHGCILRLSHFVTDPDRAIDNCYVVGLHTSLARLEPCLAGRPTPWDWEGFATAQAHYASVGLAPPVAAP